MRAPAPDILRLQSKATLLPAKFKHVQSPRSPSSAVSFTVQTGASLKLTILNPKGRIWTMVAGGGASVIYTDTVRWAVRQGLQGLSASDASSMPF